MRILTYNLWHGISPGGAFLFRTLEPELRLQERQRNQIVTLSQAGADLHFLQEVNPLSERGPELAQALGTEGFYHGDQMGVRFKGFGFPPGFSSGLATLIKPSFSPRLDSFIKLSGSAWSLEESWLALQWRESRYAILIEFLHPKWGRTLAVNVHLHHGLELTSALSHKLDELISSGTLTGAAGSELRERMNAANQRRDNELKLLLEKIEKIQSRYSMILLGGDFNFTPESDAYNTLAKAGFRDLWRDARKTEEEGYSFDGERNFANHIFSRQFPPTVEWQDLSFVPKTRELLTGIITDHENRGRRIDYLFARPIKGEVRIDSIRLFGFPGAEELAPSDHFGLMADLEWQP